jgi:hypothetical protein
MEIGQPTQQKKEIIYFTVVMVVFTIGMAFMVYYDVSAWYIWYIYFLVWTFIEYKIARNIRLKWWWWVLIISAILLIDILILELFQ